MRLDARLHIALLFWPLLSLAAPPPATPKTVEPAEARVRAQVGAVVSSVTLGDLASAGKLTAGWVMEKPAERFTALFGRAKRDALVAHYAEFATLASRGGVKMLAGPVGEGLTEVWCAPVTPTGDPKHYRDALAAQVKGGQTLYDVRLVKPGARGPDGRPPSPFFQLGYFVLEGDALRGLHDLRPLRP